MSANHLFAELFVFNDLTAFSFRAFAARASRPRGPKSSGPEQPEKTARRTSSGQAYRRAFGRPFHDAAERLGKDTPSFDASNILSCISSSFFNLPDFVAPPANPSHRRWLGSNPIAAYAGDSLSREAGHPAGSAGHSRMLWRAEPETPHGLSRWSEFHHLHIPWQVTRERRSPGGCRKSQSPV